MRRRVALLLPLLATCTASQTYPGEVLGTLHLTTQLASSTCPFDAWPDGGLIDTETDGGGLQADGGGLSATGLDLPWVLSVSPDQQKIYLTNGSTQRLGSLTGRAFSFESQTLRSVCGDVTLDEQLVGQFYGPPQATAPDGGCPILAGTGLYPDGGRWPLALAPLPDGGFTDGGLLDGGPSVCFSPSGLLGGATLTDSFQVLPDAGTDGGNLCAPIDAGVFVDCTTGYTAQGDIQP